jgi:hypothetical protein
MFFWCSSSNFSGEVKQKYFFTFFLSVIFGENFPLYFFLVLLLLVVDITSVPLPFVVVVKIKKVEKIKLYFFVVHKEGNVEKDSM